MCIALEELQKQLVVAKRELGKSVPLEAEIEWARRLEAVQEEVDQLLEAPKPKFREPRYDEVFRQGVSWLNSIYTTDQTLYGVWFVGDGDKIPPHWLLQQDGKTDFADTYVEAEKLAALFGGQVRAYSPPATVMDEDGELMGANSYTHEDDDREWTFCTEHLKAVEGGSCPECNGDRNLIQVAPVNR